MDPTAFPRMHIRLYASNLDNTIAFYNSFFGRYPVKVDSGYAEYALDQPSLIISFAERLDRMRSQFGHLGFQVQNVEILQEVRRRLGELGLDIRNEMIDDSDKAVLNKFWVEDPDGTIWEVYCDPNGIAVNDRNNGFDCDPALKESSRAAGKPCC